MMDTDCVLCEVRTEILLLEGGLCTYPGPINVGFGGQSSSGIGFLGIIMFPHVIISTRSFFYLHIRVTVVRKVGGRRL
jgi:hypothetical protein